MENFYDRTHFNGPPDGDQSGLIRFRYYLAILLEQDRTSMGKVSNISMNTYLVKSSSIIINGETFSTCDPML